MSVQAASDIEGTGTVLVRIADLDYVVENGAPVVRAAGRDENGDRRTFRIHGTRPYLYVPEGYDLDEEWSTVVTERESGYEGYDGTALDRVYTREPEHVKSIREALPDEVAWEADIKYYRRNTLDHGLTGYVRVPDAEEFHVNHVEEVDRPEEPIEPRTAILDIEVEQGEAGIPELLERTHERITAVTVYDSHSGEYHAYVLDPEERVDGHRVREYVDDHYGEREEGLTGEDIPFYLHTFETEVQLLRSLLRWFETYRPDVVTGWNYVHFDHEYLLGRMETLDGVHPHRWSDLGGVSGWQTARSVSGLPAIDLMDLYCEKMSRTEWTSTKLDYVAEELLGVGKVDASAGESYDRNRDKHLAYNIIDVALCVEIDRRERVVEFFLDLAETCGVHVVDTNYEMRLVDGYIMSRADDDEVLPSQYETDVEENAGGLVLEPPTGVREWVGVVDLKSLYPSTIITWNISPETFVEDADDGDLRIPWVPEPETLSGDPTLDDVTWDHMGTRLDGEGLVPKYIRRLFDRRDALKTERDRHGPEDVEYGVYDRRQAAIKVVMNSFYGTMSNVYWRLARTGLGDAVTSAARYSLLVGADTIKEAGYEVVYGDTDSCLVALDPEDKTDAIEEGKRVEALVNDGMDVAVEESGLDGDHPFLRDALHGTARHALVWEFEKLYRRYIQIGKKKRYAGLAVWKEGKHVEAMDVTGFESRRSETPEVGAALQERVLELVLRESTFESVSEAVRETVVRIHDRDIEPRKIAVANSIGQPIEEFKVETQTLRACRASNRAFGKRWREGDDPFLYYVRRQPPMTEPTDVIALEWHESLPDGWDYDARKHVERAIEGPLESIVEEMGWSMDEVIEGREAADAREMGW